MAVIKDNPHGIMANRFHVHNFDVFFAHHMNFLGRGVALHFGRRAFDAQFLGTHSFLLAIFEGKAQPLTRSVNAQL